jgi:hypothetical protein
MSVGVYPELFISMYWLGGRGGGKNCGGSIVANNLVDRTTDVAVCYLWIPTVSSPVTIYRWQYGKHGATASDLE